MRKDSVYLIVCKIMARKTKVDQVTVRLFGDHLKVASIEPSTWNLTTRPVRNNSVLNVLRGSAKNSAPIQFDELRIGKTWLSVISQYVD